MELLGTGLFDMVLVADGPSATELLSPSGSATPLTFRHQDGTLRGFLMRLVPQN